MKTTNGLFIIDTDDKMLIVHPTNHPMTQWSIPKGIANDMEASFAASIRETYEESNFDLDDIKSPYNYYYMGIQKYRTKKKQLEGHLVILKESFKNLDIKFKCNSFITGTKIPECDEIKLISVHSYKSYLHESQTKLFKKFYNLLYK